MDQSIFTEIQKEIEQFDLPAYQEIPNIGLFLEQITKYIGEFLSPLGDFALTGSMISNYVKKDIIRNPVKKQYDREQIGYLFFIAIAKPVLALEDIQLLISLQKDTYGSEHAYEYFRRELKKTLQNVFSGREPQPAPESVRDEKALLQSLVTAVAHKVYLDKHLQAIKGQSAAEESR